MLIWHSDARAQRDMGYKIYCAYRAAIPRFTHRYNLVEIRFVHFERPLTRTCSIYISQHVIEVTSIQPHQRPRGPA